MPTNPNSDMPAPPRRAGLADDQLDSVGRRLLGRPLTQNVWQDDPNWEANIANSPEGQAYAQRQQEQPPQPVQPAQPNNPNLGSEENFFNSLFAPGQISDAQWNVAVPKMQARGWTVLSGDKVRLPNGQEVDVRGNYGNGTGENQWLVQGAPGSGGSGGAGGAGYAGGVAGTINGASAGQPDAVTAATQAAILKQLGVMQEPTDANSATVHAITDPYHLESQRGLEATRRALAEQAYASGNLNTGGYANSQIKAVEDAGAAEANFTGQTVATQEAQRMAMLQNLLGLGTNVSEFSQQLSATQKNFADQLAQQDGQFRASLAQNIAQFGQSLGYQYALLDWTKTQHAMDSATAPTTNV